MTGENTTKRKKQNINYQREFLWHHVCVFRFRKIKIDRKPENDRGKIVLCVCVCVCVCLSVFVYRKKEDERERDSSSQGGKTLLRFLFGLDPRFPRRHPAQTHPPVSFGPPQLTDLQNNKFTHSTMDRQENQREFKVISLYLPGG